MNDISQMIDPVDLIKQFYRAFAQKDADGMLDCYHSNVTFEDPVFGKLNATEVGGMWKMLVNRGGDQLEVRLVQVSEDDGKVKARWEADYVFKTSGRFVNNKISAEFVIKDDKIISHKDDFDLHKWSSMAFGLKGTLFGGFPFFKNAVRKKARFHLNKYVEPSP